jgi:hypothetical protein
LFGSLESLSVEQLLERAEMRLRMIREHVGDPFENEHDISDIHAEIVRRRDAGIPVS